jgi:D-alanyl-D-alanine endopeptidase (penicillin-binding protein 7)
MQFHNTNYLVSMPDWNIGLQKTGFINEAGRCLVMQALIQGRNVIMVLLDSKGKLSRTADAGRVRHWLEALRPASLVNGTAAQTVTTTAPQTLITTTAVQAVTATTTAAPATTATTATVGAAVSGTPPWSSMTTAPGSR